MNEEEYREIPELPGYRIGSHGTVWTRLRFRGLGDGGGFRSYIGTEWRRMKSHSIRGYQTVSLRGNGRYVHKKISQLVLWAFVGPQPAGTYCRHLDGNPRNDRLENLAYGTPKQNSEDAMRHGTVPRGSKQWHAKLTDAKVVEILAAVASGERQRAVARRHGIDYRTVHSIIKGKNWKHIPRPAKAI